MSHRLILTIAVVLGIGVIAGSLVWAHASWMYRSNDPSLACVAGVSPENDCRIATQVIHLGTIVVVPTPEEERFAQSHASGALNAEPALRDEEGNASVKIDHG